MKDLENKSIFIIRECKAQFKKPAILWSTGKDSTVLLWLIKKAFGKIPFPVVHLDTSYKFDEIYEFRESLKEKLNLDLIVEKNVEKIKKGKTYPNLKDKISKYECCNSLKTEVLKKVIKKNNFDAILVSIRRDEHGIRNKERIFSPRNRNFKWKYKSQPPELFDIFASDFGMDVSHVRIHPLLDWTELDVWKYIKKEKIPVNPLYFSRNGKRFRSLGCYPCTVPIKSKARNVNQIIRELKRSNKKERDGRNQDKEDEYIMQKLRAMGYM